MGWHGATLLLPSVPILPCRRMPSQQSWTKVTTRF